MKFLGLAIQGIRSFRGDHVLHFPTGRGLYFIGGDNQEHPELGANGVGKSSILDALVWVFYGKTSRGQKAVDVANWTRDFPTVGACDFIKHGTQYSITRTWDPVALTLQVGAGAPRKVEQYEIDELLGVGFDLFLATTVFAQFGTSFLARDKTDKLDTISKVLNLGGWLERSERAKNKEAEQVNLLRTAEDRRVGYVASIAADEATLNEALKARQSWIDKQLRRGEFLVAQMITINTQLESLLESQEREEAQRGEAQEKLREGESELAKLDQTLRSVLIEVGEQHEKHKDHFEAERRLTHEIRTLDDLKGACPLCRQSVEVEHLEGVVAKLDKDADEHDRQILVAAQELERLNKKANLLRGQCRNRDAGNRLLYTTVERINTILANIGRDVRGVQTQHERTTTDLESYTEEANPHDSTCQRLTGRIGINRKRIESGDGDIQTIKERKAGYGYWKAEYKALRLWVCEGAMAEFSLCMHSAMDSLGLRGWQSRATLEKPNKSGKGSQRGFQVFIKSPSSPDWVPWESWCGGETQRLLLAGDTAFASLACGRMGVAPSIEVWDEPTRHLSPEGVRDLVDFLHTRARNTDRQLFLVDHNTIESGQFAGTYTVTLDHLGSRIESDMIASKIYSPAARKVSTRRAFPT